jgi:hypothetical protein
MQLLGETVLDAEALQGELHCALLPSKREKWLHMPINRGDVVTYPIFLYVFYGS